MSSAYAKAAGGRRVVDRSHTRSRRLGPGAVLAGVAAVGAAAAILLAPAAAPAERSALIDAIPFDQQRATRVSVAPVLADLIPFDEQR
jgi:hypothetical protein